MLEKTETNPIRENAGVVFITYSKFPFFYSIVVSKIFILARNLKFSVIK